MNVLRLGLFQLRIRFDYSVYISGPRQTQTWKLLQMVLQKGLQRKLKIFSSSVLNEGLLIANLQWQIVAKVEGHFLICKFTLKIIQIKLQGLRNWFSGKTSSTSSVAIASRSIQFRMAWATIYTFFMVTH